jgi:hypothetical protein
MAKLRAGSREISQPFIRRVECRVRLHDYFLAGLSFCYPAVGFRRSRRPLARVAELYGSDERFSFHD